MAALAAPNVLEILDRLDAATLARLGQAGVLQGTSALAPTEAILSLDWPELERVLPDRGLPRGVIEIASAAGARVSKGVTRGGATTIALSAVRAVHAADARAWCAWITESSAPSLYAPAVAQAGVDFERLLVVRPSPVDLARTVVKVAASGAFDLVVVDAPSGLDGKLSIPSASPTQAGQAGHARGASRSRVDGSVVDPQARSRRGGEGNDLHRPHQRRHGACGAVAGRAAGRGRTPSRGHRRARHQGPSRACVVAARRSRGLLRMR